MKQAIFGQQRLADFTSGQADTAVRLGSGARWKRPFKFVRSLLFIGRTRLFGFDPPGEPGLDNESSAMFSDLLKNSRFYLEFGAGGTTLAAAKAGVPSISIESDRFFARVVRRSLPANPSIQVIDVDLGITKEWSTPLFLRPTPRRLIRWRRYIEAPFEQIRSNGPFPDFVLVDGRYRRACALKVADEARKRAAKVKILFDDYFLPGREHYGQVEQWLGAPKRIGRAALFESALDDAVPQSVIIEAAADYR